MADGVLHGATDHARVTHLIIVLPFVQGFVAFFDPHGWARWWRRWRNMVSFAPLEEPPLPSRRGVIISFLHIRQQKRQRQQLSLRSDRKEQGDGWWRRRWATTMAPFLLGRFSSSTNFCWKENLRHGCNGFTTWLPIQSNGRMGWHRTKDPSPDTAHWRRREDDEFLSSRAKEQTRQQTKKSNSAGAIDSSWKGRWTNWQLLRWIKHRNPTGSERLIDFSSDLNTDFL